MSSIALSYYFYSLNDNIFIPIIDINKEDWKYKPESKFLLSYSNLDEFIPIFSKDINFKDLYNKNRLNLYLTDHNELNNELKEFGSVVKFIIDHHNDCHKYPYVYGNNRIISFDEKTGICVGSCCTLVTELIYKNKRIY